IREGLMKGPKALAIAPDGRILILESLNNRIQAFDTLGNAVPSFTPNPWIFTLKKADAAPQLDDRTVPGIFTDGLINNQQNYVGPLPDNSFVPELNGGKFQAQKDPLIAALATLSINLAYDPDHMDDPTQSAQIGVVQKDASWIITDPRLRSWQIVNQSGLLNVYQRPQQVEVHVQSPGSRWLLRDNSLGLAWLLEVSSGDPTLVEV